MINYKNLYMLSINTLSITQALNLFMCQDITDFPNNNIYANIYKRDRNILNKKKIASLCS